MLARSVRNPLIISVGTGLVLVSGTAPAALAATTSSTPSPSTSKTSSSDTPNPTPDPSGSTTPPPADPTITLSFEHVPSSVEQGKTASFYIDVKPHIAKGGKAPTGVELLVGSTKAHVTFDSNGKGHLDYKTLAYEKLVEISVAVPSSMSKGKVDVWAQAQADNAPPVKASPSLAIAVKAKPKPKPTHSSSSGSGSSGSHGSSGSSGSSSTSSASNLPVGGSTTPNGAKTTPQNNSAMLPSVAAPQQTQAPATAPVQNTGNTQQMRGSAEAADQLTFDKLASTQAAWLAALLVAFSLLLTQVRLGRVHVRSPKQKGAHRRPRRPGSAH